MNHPFYDILPMVIGKLQKDFYQQMTEKVKSHRITTAQLIYLLILSDGESMTLKEITNAANFNKAYTTKIIRTLYHRGLVSNDRKNICNRKYNVFLTDEGRDFVKIIEEHAKTTRNEIFSSLKPDEKENIIAALKDALNYLEPKEEDPDV